MAEMAGHKYVNRKQQKFDFLSSRPKSSYNALPSDDIFEGDTLEKAAAITGQELPAELKAPSAPARKAFAPVLKIGKKKRAGKKVQQKKAAQRRAAKVAE